MKYLWPFICILMLLTAACTKEIDLKPDPGSENTVITFYVDLVDQPDQNILKIYDNYEYFLDDTLPVEISIGHTMNYHSLTTHILIFPKEPEKELWIRVNSVTFSYPFFDRNYIYKSSFFLPVTDSLIIDAEYVNWIQE
ncbi:MAG: hypothetical protein IPH20_02530 [Bacteroidales bacterium]|nr:hypothetical protein [Bacteroidales bacterium]